MENPPAVRARYLTDGPARVLIARVYFQAARTFCLKSSPAPLGVFALAGDQRRELAAVHQPIRNAEVDANCLVLLAYQSENSNR